MNRIMKQIPMHPLRGALIALALLCALLVPLLRAQPAAAPATNVAATPVTTGTTTATTDTTTGTTTAIITTNAAPTDAAAPAEPASTNAEPEGPPTPGEMAAPGSELVGPPAPGSSNAPAGVGLGGPESMPTNNPAVTDVTNNPGAVAGLGQRKLPFYFGLDVGEMYDDNILISPDNEKVDAFITHITPSIDYMLGDQTSPHMNYLNLYFAPSIYLYDNRSQYNRTDYNGDIYYQYTWTRLQLGLEQNYQHLTDASLDEGTLVSRNIYTTKAIADYLYNDDLTLYATGTQQISNYPTLDLTEYDLDTFALYQVAPKLQVGAGPRFAWLDISGAPNETHQDLLARLRYVPDSKFVVSFEGGAEYLQYQGSTPSRILPIFDMNVTYVPFLDTTLFVAASKSTNNSFDLNGDTIDTTQIQAGASQVFLRNFKATLTGGYNNSEYQGNQGDSQNGQHREDDYFFGKGALEWAPNQWLQVEASYQYSNNDSTFNQFGFTDNQVDLQTTVKF
jgi:hypothetical protein